MGLSYGYFARHWQIVPTNGDNKSNTSSKRLWHMRDATMVASSAPPLPSNAVGHHVKAFHPRRILQPTDIQESLACTPLPISLSPEPGARSLEPGARLGVGSPRPKVVDHVLRATCYSHICTAQSTRVSRRRWVDSTAYNSSRPMRCAHHAGRNQRGRVLFFSNQVGSYVSAAVSAQFISSR